MILDDPNARRMSHWDDVHERLLYQDIARMQDLDAAIELEDRTAGAKTWRHKQKRNGAIRRRKS